jgi:lipoyl(octanoyl) transferase
VTAPALADGSRIGDLAYHYPGFGPDAVDYRAGWDLQRRLHAQRVADEIGDVAVMLEHLPVYTAGKRTEPADRPFDGTPVVEVDRGGKITWHGPGQLVGYPICKLPSHVYVVDYVRRLEEALIRACADLGVVTGRVKGRSGVWLAAGGGRPERKVAALGVRVSAGVTMHGFALNCDNPSAPFDAIVPCGIADAGVTSLSAELGRDVTVRDALPAVERHLSELLRWGEYDRAPDIDRAEPEPSAAPAAVTYGLQVGVR